MTFSTISLALAMWVRARRSAAPRGDGLVDPAVLLVGVLEPALGAQEERVEVADGQPHDARQPAHGTVPRRAQDLVVELHMRLEPPVGILALHALCHALEP